MDILIKNGHVIDPKNNIDKITDIGITAGKVIKVGNVGSDTAEKIFDAGGCYVIPGIIDYHAHIAPLCEIGIPAEPICFSSGVTTIVDAGSTGCSNYESYRAYILSSKLRIKCFLNVCSAGLVTNSYLENIDPKNYNKNKITRLFEKYPDELMGIKIRMDQKLTGNLGIEPLIRTIEMAEEIGTRVVVHTTNAAIPQRDLADVLRKGDVFTHMYHNFDNSIIDENGKVHNNIRKARERGVIFDSANARFHFAFKIANAAISDGFLPDIISTDLTKKSMYKKPQIFNMTFLLSKYLNMGLDLFTIIKLCTVNPAMLLGMEDEIGQLGINSCADIVILKVMDKKVWFEDWEGGILQGEKLLRNMMTIKDGEVVYQDIEF